MPKRMIALTLGGVSLLVAVAVSLYIVILSPDDASEQAQDPDHAQDPAQAQNRDQAGPAPDDLAVYCTALTGGANPYVGTGQRDELLRMSETSSSGSHSDFINLHMMLAGDYLRFGETEEAVRLLTQALEAEERDDSDGTHEAALLQGLAISYLKMGEADNCLVPSGELICALPLDRSKSQQNRRGSSNAIKHLLRLLELDPDDVRARWLLNVAHMNLGTYPEEVPEAYLIAVEGQDSGYEIGNSRT